MHGPKSNFKNTNGSKTFPTWSKMTLPNLSTKLSLKTIVATWKSRRCRCFLFQKRSKNSKPLWRSSKTSLITCLMEHLNNLSIKLYEKRQLILVKQRSRMRRSLWSFYRVIFIQNLKKLLRNSQWSMQRLKTKDSRSRYQIFLSNWRQTKKITPKISFNLKRSQSRK